MKQDICIIPGFFRAVNKGNTAQLRLRDSAVFWLHFFRLKNGKYSQPLPALADFISASWMRR